MPRAKFAFGAGEAEFGSPDVEALRKNERVHQEREDRIIMTVKTTSRDQEIKA